ncbi:hypothetical protein BJV74DRAFT_884544 [Russula compacta]|nr:hypothetical protein BJV74DRAFT_884544 [Russula compacta]
MASSAITQTLPDTNSSSNSTTTSPTSSGSPPTPSVEDNMVKIVGAPFMIIRGGKDTMVKVHLPQHILSNQRYSHLLSLQTGSPRRPTTTNRFLGMQHLPSINWLRTLTKLSASITMPLMTSSEHLHSQRQPTMGLHPFRPSSPISGPGGVPLEPVAPLEPSASHWTPASISRKIKAVDPDPPDIIHRKVKGLLNKLTMEKFDSISDQIIAWVTDESAQSEIELFKLQMLTECFMHERVKKLLENLKNLEEEKIESLCKLLLTVGTILETNKAWAHMDLCFSCMKGLAKSPNVSSHMQFTLQQDVIELSLATLAEICEMEKAAQETESFNRQIIAGGSGAPQPPSKAGDLSNFSKISKTAPMTFGPNSIFAAKKDAKRESLSHTNSNSNMFSMLSQNLEVSVEASALKSSWPPSHKPSINLTQLAAPSTAPLQRKKLNLLPQSIPTVEEPGPAAMPKESTSNDGEPAAAELMSEADALKKIDEDSKEFLVFAISRKQRYTSQTSPAEHHF